MFSTIDIMDKYADVNFTQSCSISICKLFKYIQFSHQVSVHTLADTLDAGITQERSLLAYASVRARGEGAWL